MHHHITIKIVIIHFRKQKMVFKHIKCCWEFFASLFAQIQQTFPVELTYLVKCTWYIAVEIFEPNSRGASSDGL